MGLTEWMYVSLILGSIVTISLLFVVIILRSIHHEFRKMNNILSNRVEDLIQRLLN